MFSPWIFIFEKFMPHILTENELKEIKHIYMSDLKLSRLKKGRKPKKLRKAK